MNDQGSISAGSNSTKLSPLITHIEQQLLSHETSIYTENGLIYMLIIDQGLLKSFNESALWTVAFRMYYFDVTEIGPNSEHSPRWWI